MQHKFAPLAQKFRPKPELGTYIYRYDPVTKGISMMADKFVKPNGLCFSPDFKTLYVTDTGACMSARFIVTISCAKVSALTCVVLHHNIALSVEPSPVLLVLLLS